jgi:hypothetical protein
MIPLRPSQTIPPYQLEAIQWLADFENVELQQQLLANFQFSEIEIIAFRNCWLNCLQSKRILNKKCGEGDRLP